MTMCGRFSGIGCIPQVPPCESGGRASQPLPEDPASPEASRSVTSSSSSSLPSNHPRPRKPFSRSAYKETPRIDRSIDGHSKKSKCRTFVSSSSPRLSSRWVAPGSRRATKDPPSKTLVRNCARFALCRTARPAFTPPYSFKYVQLFVFNGRRDPRERVPLPLSPSPSLSRSPSLTPKLLARQARTASTTSRW